MEGVCGICGSTLPCRHVRPLCTSDNPYASTKGLYCGTWEPTVVSESLWVDKGRYNTKYPEPLPTEFDHDPTMFHRRYRGHGLWDTPGGVRYRRRQNGTTSPTGTPGRGVLPYSVRQNGLVDGKRGSVMRPVQSRLSTSDLEP